MQRAIWRGTIRFGLVQIPVGLHGAAERDALRFDLLDRRDMSPIGYRRINKRTGEPVAWADVVKGYEYADGRHVAVEPQDFERANVAATRTIDILRFIDLAELDVLYFERPYYVVPDEAGERAYVLLREALRRQRKVGLARVVIRTREHLAALLVRGEALVLEQLRWPDELAPTSSLDLPRLGARDVSAPELRLAERLIAETTGPFAPGELHDTYREDLMRLIHRKVDEGDRPRAEPPPLPADSTEVVDIMMLLRRSLGRPPAKVARLPRATSSGKRPHKASATRRKPGRAATRKAS